jgi:putative transposase
MPRIVRIAKIVVLDLPHHVSQRDIFGQNVFENDAGSNTYLKWLSEHDQLYRTKSWSYCLMTNHVYYIVVQKIVNL